MRRLTRLLGSGTVQSRVLTIALVPSVALLAVGATVSGVLIDDGLTVHEFATKLGSAAAPSTHLLNDVQNERRLTLQWMSGPKQDRLALDQQRAKTDATLAQVTSVTSDIADGASDEVVKDVTALRQEIDKVSVTRRLADSGTADPKAVYGAYNDLMNAFGATMRAYARSSPDASVAYEELIAVDLFYAADSEARGHALAASLANQGMTQQQFHEYIHQIGAYHEDLEKLVSRMTPQEQAHYERINADPAWKRLTDIQNILQAQGAAAISGHLALPFSAQEWQDLAYDVALQLDSLYRDHADHAAQLGADSAQTTLITSLASGTVILVLAVGGMVVALRISRRLVQRLTGLRRDTLQLAERDLPSVVQRLRAGESIDVESQVAWLNHGDDEIGQVADAFNKAQRMAVESTVHEAETRQGVRSVFLNIAHRSQVMVHRQLKVLDKAERSQEDPDQLELLFQLDHLATQSRRNAENLIILGGERPGRQWRNPVALLELVRSAVSETEHYDRVNTGKLPEVSLKGAVVADLIHLFAELVDNATSFSPPESRVEVHGNLVGSGVVVEIEDQGLGVEPERLHELNTMLHSPPDFGMMALTSESRIGLFVVSQLAARHNIRITLRDSVYGGVSAIVVIPTDLIVEETAGDDEFAGDAMQIPPGPPNGAEPQLPRRSNGGGKNRKQTTMNGQLPTTVPNARADSDGAAAAPPAPRKDNQVSNRPTTAAESGAPTRSSTMDPGHRRQNGSQPTGQWPKAEKGPPPSSPNSTEAPPPRTTAQPGTTHPAGAGGTAGGKPPLPQRKRQANLAPQLRDNVVLGVSEPQQTVPGPDGTPPTAERSRATMAAFQKGTRRARAADADANPQAGRSRGDE